MINFFANVDEGWLQRTASTPTPHYYFTRPSIAFSRFWALLELFEAEQVFIDARFVEQRELEFVKFSKAFHWVMSDVALFKGLDYDQDTGGAHFTSDRLRAICETFAADSSTPEAPSLGNSKHGS